LHRPVIHAVQNADPLHVQYTIDAESGRHVNRPNHAVDCFAYWPASAALQYAGHTILYNQPDWPINGLEAWTAGWWPQYGFHSAIYVLQCHLPEYEQHDNVPRHSGLQRILQSTWSLPDPVIHLSH